MSIGLQRQVPGPLIAWVLLARGLSNAEIASQSVVGEATVKTHVARVLVDVASRRGRVAPSLSQSGPGPPAVIV